MNHPAQAQDQGKERSHPEDTRRRVISPALVRRLREFFAGVETGLDQATRDDQTNSEDAVSPTDLPRKLTMRDRFQTVFGDGQAVCAKSHEFDQVVAEYNFRIRALANADPTKQRRIDEQRQLVVQAIRSSYGEQQSTVADLGRFAKSIVEWTVISAPPPDVEGPCAAESRDRECDRLLAQLKLPALDDIVASCPRTTGNEWPHSLLADARGWARKNDLSIARSFRQQILDRGVEIALFGLMRIEKDLQRAKLCAFRYLVSEGSRPTSIVWQQTNASSKPSCDRIRHESQLEDVLVYPYESIPHARGVDLPSRISGLIESAPHCLRPVLELVAGTVVAERFVRFNGEDVAWTRTQESDPVLTLFRNYVVASTSALDDPDVAKETDDG